jgi:hypothetical protein
MSIQCIISAWGGGTWIGPLPNFLRDVERCGKSLTGFAWRQKKKPGRALEEPAGRGVNLGSGPGTPEGPRSFAGT